MRIHQPENRGSTLGSGVWLPGRIFWNKIMGQAIGWLIVLAVVGLMIWALARENQRLRNRSSQEYERDIYAARDSMLRAGLVELDKFVGEAQGKRAAVEFLKDEEQGQTKTGSKGDDAERTKAPVKEQPDDGLPTENR